MWPWYWIGSFCGYLQPLVYLVLWVFCWELPLCTIYENQWILGTILIMISDPPKNHQKLPKTTKNPKSVCVSDPPEQPCLLTDLSDRNIKINLSKKLTKNLPNLLTHYTVSTGSVMEFFQKWVKTSSKEIIVRQDFRN